MAQQVKENRRVRRHRRIRKTLAGTAEHPRLYVFRSGRHIYAGLADDDAGRTILSVSTMVKELRERLPKQKTGNCLAAKETGKLLAVRAKEKGIRKVVFDRGGFLFHGRVKALAEGAREGGLCF